MRTSKHLSRPLSSLALLVALAPTGCGHGATAQADPIQGDAPDAGADVDIADVWPTTDPSMGQGPEGGPSFSPDAGDGGPSPPAPCSGKAGAGGDQTVTLPFAGLLRTALVHVPASYAPTKPTMVIMNFHGFTSDGLEESVLSRMNASSDAHGYIAVYPYGVANSFNAGTCCGTAWLDSVDDVGFVKALLANLAGQYCTDPARVFATGMSNGGFLSHRLGCEMASTFAAIAPVAGVIGLPDGACKPSRPMPILQFHGTSDPLVPYAGGNPALSLGIAGMAAFPSVAATMEMWRKLDGCGTEQSVVYQKGDTTCVEWQGCQGGSQVALCTVKNGGHTWPGGVPIPSLGATTSDISATDSMVGFFQAHPMP